MQLRRATPADYATLVCKTHRELAAKLKHFPGLDR